MRATTYFRAMNLAVGEYRRLLVLYRVGDKVNTRVIARRNRQARVFERKILGIIEAYEQLREKVHEHDMEYLEAGFYPEKGG